MRLKSLLSNSLYKCPSEDLDKKRKRNIAFSLHGHACPCPGGHEMYNFGKFFLGYHNFILNLSNPCPRKEEEKKYCIFTIWPCPSTRTSVRGGHKIDILSFI